MKAAKIIKRFRVGKADKFRLSDYDPADTCGLELEKDVAKALLDTGVQRLSDLQERLYANDRWSVLLVFQAMDAAGKDSAIKHVMSGINPQGCQVHAFKQPSTEELDHDFLWRCAVRLPERGRIGIFNRSYYEDVLVVRVHPELLARQRVPEELKGKDVWKERFHSIRSFERHLADNGVLILKFFLYVSKEEQRKRFLERLEDPAKNWKFSMSDIAERKLWDSYMDAYEDMIRATSRDEAPWHVIPADNKWFARLVIAGTIVEAMEKLDLKYPKADGADHTEMEKVRKALLAEGKAT
jgi:PPK2 family polyphosphate:nucleotide phosphotransferase